MNNFLFNINNNVLKSYLSKISLFVLFVIMIYSMKPWVFWNNSIALLYVFIILFIFLRFPLLSLKLKREQLIVCFFCLIMYGVLDLFHLHRWVFFVQYLFRHILFVVCIILFTEKEKKKLVDLFTFLYSVIILVTMIFYIVYLFDVDLPYSIIKYEPNTGYPTFRNYTFLIVCNKIEFFSRFQSVFLEPGHLGMVSSILLYVNKYDLKKKRNLIVLLSSILSFSLASYVLLVFGFVVNYILNNDNRVKRFFKALLFLSFVMATSIYLYVYDSDSVFSRLIVARLDYRENIDIKRNYRTTLSFDSYYDERFYKVENCLLGIGIDEFTKKFEWGNSSYKTFIVTYGVLGLVVLILFYLAFVYLYMSSFLIGLFLIYLVSFLQRPYALWEVEICLFICSSYLKKKDSNK